MCIRNVGQRFSQEKAILTVYAVPMMIYLLAPAHGYETFEETISMPISNITTPDTYLCYAVPVEQLRKGSVVGFKVTSTKHVAHHVTSALCEDYASDEALWDCGEQQGGVCIGSMVYLGGKDGDLNEHAEMDFPKDVGIELGKATNMKYIVLQVHYKSQSTAEDLTQPSVNLTLEMTEERRPYQMQEILLVSSGYIPAKSDFSSEIALKWTGMRVLAVSYSIHTHHYGLLVEGYLIRNGVVSLIGREKVTGRAHPEFNVDEPFFIENGDIIAARCIYRNNETFPVKFGLRDQDEMCNFGINFKYRTKDSLSYPMSIVQEQSAQNSTWCADVVTGTKVLCGISNTMNYDM